MEKRQSAAFILLNNSKGRAVNDILDPESFRKTLGKYGFTDTEVPM
jgi:hypothetical protein